MRDEFNQTDFSRKTCRQCKKGYLGQSWAKSCVNCNQAYKNLPKKALLSEEQMLDILELQAKMRVVNQAILDKRRADEVATEQRELEELRTRIYNKYLKEFGYEKAPESTTQFGG